MKPKTLLLSTLVLVMWLPFSAASGPETYSAPYTAYGIEIHPFGAFMPPSTAPHTLPPWTATVVSISATGPHNTAAVAVSDVLGLPAYTACFYAGNTLISCASHYNSAAAESSPGIDRVDVWVYSFGWDTTTNDVGIAMYGVVEAAFDV